MFKKDEYHRFETIHIDVNTEMAKILVDKETGVHYLYVTTGHSGGLTPLLDSEGKVIVKKRF